MDFQRVPLRFQPTHGIDPTGPLKEKLLVDKASRMKEAKERLDQALGIFPQNKDPLRVKESKVQGE